MPLFQSLHILTVNIVYLLCDISVYYRLRVDKYRVFSMIEGNSAIVLRIFNKKDVERFIRNLN
jgi:hypothetical protein